jgi:hypothetical protein
MIPFPPGLDIDLVGLVMCLEADSSTEGTITVGDLVEGILKENLEEEYLNGGHDREAKTDPALALWQRGWRR